MRTEKDCKLRQAEPEGHYKDCGRARKPLDTTTRIFMGAGGEEAQNKEEGVGRHQKKRVERRELHHLKSSGSMTPVQQEAKEQDQGKKGQGERKVNAG